jgi:hypothetical protein
VERPAAGVGQDLADADDATRTAARARTRTLHL